MTHLFSAHRTLLAGFCPTVWISYYSLLFWDMSQGLEPMEVFQSTKSDAFQLLEQISVFVGQEEVPSRTVLRFLRVFNGFHFSVFRCFDSIFGKLHQAVDSAAQLQTRVFVVFGGRFLVRSWVRGLVEW